MSQDALAPIGVIAHYNLLELLDASGPGDLYRARDTKHGRTVAVRVLPADFTDDQAALIDGARRVQTLSHPNAITVFDVGAHAGRVYIAFEFLKGRPLRSEMAGQAVNVQRAVEMTIQIADAVADAHATGFLHGGLSPDCVIVTAKGNAKIPAFELAVQHGIEYDGARARLHDYSAPEEERGQRPDERSDVYSVGAILYEMLTNRRPNPRGASAPGATNPKVPRPLDAIVLRAVAPNPESRFQSVAAFAAELRAATTTRDAEERAVPSTPPVATSISRVVLTTLVMMAGVAAIIWWVMRS